MEDNSAMGRDLQKELAYYKKQLDRISGETIRNDFTLSLVRDELRQKKEAFDILINLQQKFSIDVPLDIIFAQTVKAIRMQLRMDRAIILTHTTKNLFKSLCLRTMENFLCLN